jgi:hypothetical protein
MALSTDIMNNTQDVPTPFNHPDTYIAALRVELGRHPENKDVIEAEIAKADKRERPVVLAVSDTGEPVVDHTVIYLIGLEEELNRHPEKATEIRAEIKRVKARRDSVGQRGVERAVTDRRTKLDKD